MNWGAAKSRFYGNFVGKISKSFRKGEVMTEEELPHVKVVHVYAMPHVSEAPADMVQVDVHFQIIGVDKAAAEEHRKEFIEICEAYPKRERLRGGVSYIEAGAEFESQEGALHFYAIGEVLELWNVVTPERMGITGQDADDLAGGGLVMMTGFHGDVKTESSDEEFERLGGVLSDIVKEEKERKE